MSNARKVQEAIQALQEAGFKQHQSYAVHECVAAALNKKVWSGSGNGIKYFIEVKIYDYSRINPSAFLVFNADVQFQSRHTHAALNFSMQFDIEEIERMEQDMETVFQRMEGFDYN